jgi:hypothetical protein
MAVAFNFMTFINVPVVIIFLSAFVEAFSFTEALLLNFKFGLLKSSLDFERFNILSLSFTDSCLTYVSSGFNSSVCNQSLYRNDGGLDFVLLGDKVLAGGSVVEVV